MSAIRYPMTIYQREAVEKLLPVVGDRPFNTREVTKICGQMSPAAIKGLKESKAVKRLFRYTSSKPSVYQFTTEFIEWFRIKNPGVEVATTT